MLILLMVFSKSALAESARVAAPDDVAAIATCLDGAYYDDALACIPTPGSGCDPSEAYGDCLHRLTLAWQVIMVSEFSAAQTRLSQDGVTGFDGAIWQPQSDLQASQRAFEAFRKADCDSQRSAWSGGDEGASLAEECLL